MHKNIVVVAAAIVVIMIVGVTAQGGPYPCNGPHESVRCVKDCPPPWTCQNRDEIYDCPEQEDCKRRCVCDPGYYRNSVNQCVTYECCGDQQCGPHSTHSDQKSYCPTDLCSSINKRYNCSLYGVGPGCVCDGGYMRIKENGPCIPQEQCPNWPGK